MVESRGVIRFEVEFRVGLFVVERGDLILRVD